MFLLFHYELGPEEDISHALALSAGNLPVEDHFAVLDLVAGVAKGNEGLILWVIYENVPIGEEEDFGALDWIVSAIPAGLPELVTDLESNHGLARAGRHRQ